MELITLEEARVLKLCHFYTGVPCINGHYSPRYVKGGKGCVQCARERVDKWRINNPEKHRRKVARAAFNNRATVNAKNARRRASKLNATPVWVDIKRLRAIYNNCPKGYQVDHIIPLQGETVCGLHVPWNLQYLTPSENCSKSNNLLY